ncbi:MOS1T transposase, partial [Pseudoatta argentina]
IYGEHAPSKTSCKEWFRRFNIGDFDVRDKELEPFFEGAPKKFEDAELQALLEEDSCLSLDRLVKELNVDRFTVAKRSTRKGNGAKRKKLGAIQIERERDMERRLVISEMLRQQYLNSLPHRSIGTTSFNILFGATMRLKDNVEIRELIESEWIAAFQENRSKLREDAKANIRKIQCENAKTFNKRRKEAYLYREEDLVAIKKTQVGPGSKFAPKFLGPYRISKVLRNDRYLVTRVGDHIGPQQTSTSADHMKPWVSDIDSDESSEDDDETSEDGCISRMAECGI